MRNLTVTLVTLGLFVSGASRADSQLKAEDAPPPTPGVLLPSSPEASSPSCGPIGYARTDRDLAPGRGLRVTGGMFLGLGLATLVPGAAMLGWANTYDPMHDRAVDDLRSIKVSGAIATAFGAASVLASIPIIAVGVHRGKQARNERVTLAPSVGPTAGGAMTALGGTF